MILSGTPAELIDFLLRLCGLRCRRAVSAEILFVSKGTFMTNTATVGPGGNVTGLAKGRDPSGAPALLKTPLVWTTDDGIAGATVTPSADTFAVVVKLPPDVTSGTLTLTMQSADPAVSATGTITVAEGAATSATIEFTVNPTPAPGP